MSSTSARAAYDLLALRAEVEDNQEMLRLAEWWGEFQDATPARQKAMLSTLGDDPAPRRARQRRPRRRAPRKEGA